MKTSSITSKTTRSAWAKSLLLGCSAALLCAAPLTAQTSYTAVDLTPNASGVANVASDGIAAGFTGSVPNAFSGRATIWSGAGATDLHPSFLDGASARSTISGYGGDLQVGSGAGTSTVNRNVPIVWRGTAASATVLTIPFVNYSGQALATDGKQIVGSAIGLNRDGTTLSTYHAIVWNATTGAGIDLGDGGNGAQALAVSGGVQVGYIVKSLQEAALWRGTKAVTSLNPTGAVTSCAQGTDGVRQVGFAGYDIRVRVEAFKGQKTARFTYATVWNGTAASAVNIHPYASNADGTPFAHSYATSVSGSYIAGYAADASKIGTPAYYRAIVWDASFQATDLSAFLPAGFVGSQALSVDSQGNIAGVMTKADGTRHAVLWMPNP